LISIDEAGVRGFLHSPGKANGDGVVMTHGAGANCETKLLVGISEALAEQGFAVLRYDLPFRRERPHGPPSFGSAAKDREGVRKAVELIRGKVSGKVFAGGHSYGGRQTTMLIAEAPELVDGLLLLSYPLHPPKKPQEMRTKHFPELKKAGFFVHGARDPFGTLDEMKEALKLIPAKTKLFEVKSGGHELLGKSGSEGVLREIVESFAAFMA
jgi:uncharacterized protein